MKKRLFLIASFLFLTYASAQTLYPLNCAPGTVCTYNPATNTTAPNNTGTGDTLGLASGKINFNENALLVALSNILFSAIASGTNTKGTMICSTGCFFGFSANGTVSANQVNNQTLPANTTMIGTNASGGIVTINGHKYPPLTFAAINAIGCNAGNDGSTYYITDSAQSAFAASILAGGSNNHVLALCNGAASQWQVH